jgi:hypothetical protein
MSCISIEAKYMSNFAYDPADRAILITLIASPPVTTVGNELRLELL